MWVGVYVYVKRLAVPGDTVETSKQRFGVPHIPGRCVIHNAATQDIADIVPC